MKTISVNDVFGYVGVAAIGVAGYAWFDGNHNFALASVSVGAFAFYASIANLKERLAESRRQSQDDSRQRETDDIRNEIHKLRNHIDSRVKQTTFDDCIRNVSDLVDDESRERHLDNESVYRHMEAEMNGIHAELSEIKYRLVQIEANEFACCSTSSKRK